MKVAWFTHRYHPCLGGAETYGRAIVRRLVAEGHAVDVFTSDAHDLWYFNNPRRKRLEAPAESLVDGARVRRFAIRHYPMQRYFGRLLSYAPHWPTRCRFASYMPILPGIDRVRGDYDAVFGVGFPFTVFSYAALRTARAAGAPLVLTPFLHLATPGDPVNRAYTKPHRIRLLKEADLVVVQTDLEADAVRTWGLDDDRVFKLGMAVEHGDVTGGSAARFRRDYNIPEGRRVVGHLACLDLNKGTVDLLESVAHLNQSRGNKPVQLVLAGTSSPDFERYLAASPHRDADWLTLIRPLPIDGRPDFYAALDVFAMPSRTDSFGIVFLEAWANTLPVVAAAAGGVPDVVQDGKTGLLVPFGDVPRLAEALARFVDDPALAAMVGLAGRARVARGFTWDAKYQTLRDRTRAVMPRRPIARTRLAEAS